MRNINFLSSALIAHRGYHNIQKGIPENSILAFKEAIENNLIIELDVHILKDGNVAVFHDDNLMRMTGINKNIKDMNYNELKKIRLQETNQTIPLLVDVLKLIDGQVPLIIETKYDAKYGVLEKEVIKILQQYNGMFAVKSFNPFSVMYFKRKFPEAIRGQLASDFRDKKMRKIKKVFLSRMVLNFFTKPDFISYDIRALPNNRVRKLRKNKLILGWTVKSKKDLEYAQDYCDNFICENIDFHTINKSEMDMKIR